MTESVRRLLGLPEPLPETPPEWLEMWRPSARWFRLRKALWGLEQVVDLIGIVISLAVLRGIEIPFLPFLDDLNELFLRWIPEVGIGPVVLEGEAILVALELGAIAFFVVHLFFSWARLHVEWSQRWALLGERAVRIHEGFWTEREMTLSLANVQNMSLRQGPLQRFLGVADIEIRTAGGGSGADAEGQNAVHKARIRALEDADRILERLRRAVERHRGSGIGGAASRSVRNGRARGGSEPAVGDDGGRPLGGGAAHVGVGDESRAARALRDEAARFGEVVRRVARSRPGAGSCRDYTPGDSNGTNAPPRTSSGDGPEPRSNDDSEVRAMRLVTRGDADGLMCAALLKAAGIVDEVMQAHPKDVQDGKVEVGSDDIIANLPYAEGCGMWFDHHSSEQTAERLPESFVGRYAIAPSAARLVYEHFVGDHPELSRFDDLLEVVDRFDSAQLTREDVESPSPGMLLCFLVDPRTGLGYHHSYRISNKALTDRLPEWMTEHSPEEILAMPDLQERVKRYEELNEAAAAAYTARSRREGTVLITDFRDADEIPPANRFLVYTLPAAEGTNVSVRLSMARGGENVSIQVGHDILNRTCTADVGALMRARGGGGHRGAGTCQVPASEADAVLAELVDELQA